MNQIIKLSASILILPFCFLLLCSCESTRASTNKVDVVTDQLFMEGPDINKDETYSQIKGSVHRLHSILCGRFVQYSVGRDPKQKEYATWLINEGQDSVVVYHLPIGESNKDGYWMYNCQVMTSLPNQPLHATFSKLEEVNRDTINAIYYAVPENFKATLNEMLDDPEKAFEAINLNKLERMEGQDIAYVRETSIHYKAETEVYQDKEGNNLATYFLIRPQMIVFGFNIYDENEKFLETTQGERLMKNGMINPKFLK